MILPEYFDLFTIIKNKRQTDKIKEDLIKNLGSKGVRTSFVQVNLNNEKLMIKLNFESYARPYRYGRFVFDKSSVESELAALSDVINRHLPAICVGKAGDPVAAVEAFRKELKMAGHDKVLEEVQRQLTEFKNSLN